MLESISELETGVNIAWGDGGEAAKVFNSMSYMPLVLKLAKYYFYDSLRLPKFLTWQLQLNLSKTFFNFCLRKNEKGKEVKSDCARAFIMFHLLD